MSFLDLLGELLFGPGEAQPPNPTPSSHPFRKERRCLGPGTKQGASEASRLQPSLGKP